MNLDVTLVLYRPTPAEVESAIRAWTPLLGEFRRLRVLVSGSSAQHRVASEAFEALASCELILRFDNIGFAGGHNVLLHRAFEDGADAALVTNPDMRIATGSLSDFVQRSNTLYPRNLVAPALERLDDSFVFTGSTDSRGIRWDSWGRHFDIDQGASFHPDQSASETLGVSGACMLVSKAVFSRVVRASGYFFDEFYLAYREDAELGIRARLLGIKSFVIDMEGFGHVRTVRGSKRGKPLQDMLGVKNRFLLKYNLGRHRPGNPLLARIRDLMVIAGTFTIERTSAPGFIAARRVRRAARARGKTVLSAPLSENADSVRPSVGVER